MNKLPKDEFDAAYDKAAQQYRDANRVEAHDLDNAIYPVKTRVKKTFNPTDNADEMQGFYKEQGIPKENERYYEDGNYLFLESKEFVDYLKKRGYDSMMVKESQGINAPFTTMAVFEPNKIRSIYAKFDPLKKESANILSGSAAAALGLNALNNYREE